MSKIKNFYQLDAWKKGHKLVKGIYKHTEKFPDNEKYGLTNQLNRASSSITANIAEGFGRFHFPDKVRFYYQARGSLKETQNFILLAKDLNYLDKEHAKLLWKLSIQVDKLINGLIRSIEREK